MSSGYKTNSDRCLRSVGTTERNGIVNAERWWVQARGGLVVRGAKPVNFQSCCFGRSRSEIHPPSFNVYALVWTDTPGGRAQARDGAGSIKKTDLCAGVKCWLRDPVQGCFFSKR